MRIRNPAGGGEGEEEVSGHAAPGVHQANGGADGGCPQPDLRQSAVADPGSG